MISWPKTKSLWNCFRLFTLGPGRIAKNKGRKSQDTVFTRAWNSLIWFPSQSLVFYPKMSRWAIRSKNWAIPSFAHFWWAKWAFRSHCSFDLSEMSNSLTSLTKKEKMSKNERFAHFFKKIFKKTLIKTWWNKILDFFSQICLSKSLIRSFPLSKMSNSLTSLISSERPEQIAHGCSFLVSDLSDSLRVAHLSWVICANRSQLLSSFDLSEMSKWANERWANSQHCITLIVTVFFSFLA